MSNSEGKVFGYSIMGFFAGIYLFYKGLKAVRLKHLIENIPTSKIRSVAMGLVEIYGEVIPIEGKLLKSPLTNTSCVYYKYTVEVRGKHWNVIKKGKCTAPFYLKDETGKVRIDPRNAQVSMSFDTEQHSGANGEPSVEIKRFLKKHKISYKGLLFKKDMRFREWLIQPKDNIYILGTAEPCILNKEIIGKNVVKNVIIRNGKQDNIYYISDKPEHKVLEKLRWKCISGVFGGAALTIVCLIIILGMLNLF